MQQLLTPIFLREHGLTKLCEDFGLKATRHGEFPNLVLLKYGQRISPMAERIVQECRSLIVDESADWAAVSVPFFKFFNANEVNAAAVDWETARVYEKLDGSLMSIYFYAGEWRVASSGTPDASGPMGDLGISMAQCFWQTWQEAGYLVPGEEWKGATFMFEFMSQWNRVIVAHDKARIVFIGGRDHKFQEFGPEEYSESGWETVKSFPLTSLTEALAAAEELKPLVSEGYVVRDAAFNRVKIKSPAYVALHLLRDSFSRRRLVEIVQKNESEEFLAYFPAFEPEYREVKTRFDALVETTEKAWQEFPHFAPDQQKEFALAVQNTPYAGVFCTLRSGKVDSVRAFYEAMLSDRLLKLLDSQ
ncbi:2'-5' RNA ligase [bacterium]|nr:MAG: 2'-5' RNA ligase [bacterium]